LEARIVEFGKRYRAGEGGFSQGEVDKIYRELHKRGTTDYKGEHFEEVVKVILRFPVSHVPFHIKLESDDNKEINEFLRKYSDQNWEIIYRGQSFSDEFTFGEFRKKEYFREAKEEAERRSKYDREEYARRQKRAEEVEARLAAEEEEEERRESIKQFRPKEMPGTVRRIDD
jgi:hypothetical protein